MEYLIEDWLFKPNEKKLYNIKKKHQVRLTDQQTAILIILCEKEGGIAEQLEIEAKVWSGNVTDNTFKTAITNLRKAFDYESSFGKNIIINVRSKGYRLANISKNELENNPKKKQSVYVQILLSTIIFLAIYLLILLVIPANEGENELVTDSFKIITFEQGAEMAPVFNTAKKLMAYISFESNILEHKVKVRNLDSNQIISFPNYQYSSSPFWVKNELYFQAYTDGKCLILRSTYIEDLTFEEPELVTSCGSSQSISPIQIDSLNKWLYFSYKESENSPFVIKRFSLRTKRSEQLTNGAIDSYGAYSISLSPDNNKLAYLTMAANSDASLRILDLKSATTKEVYKGLSYALSVTWSNNKELLVPISKTLYKVDIDTNEKTVIKKFEEPVYSIGFDDEKNYVASYGYLYTSKIKEISGENSRTIYSSQTQLGQIIIQDNNIYFVGQLNGDSQIWKLSNSELHQLTSYETAKRISSLSLSANGKFLAFLVGNDIAWIDIHSQKLQNLKLNSNEKKDLVWSCDSKALLYTSKNSGYWQLNEIVPFDSSPKGKRLHQDIFRVKSDCNANTLAFSDVNSTIHMKVGKGSKVKFNNDNYISNLDWNIFKGTLFFNEKGRLFELDNLGNIKLIYEGKSKMNSFFIQKGTLYVTERTIGDNKLVVFKNLNKY